MTTTLKRGLGGRKDIQVLILIVILGLVAVCFALVFRRQVQAPPPPPPTGLSVDALLAQGAKARGSEVDRVYAPGDMATLVSPAVGRNSQDEWVALPADFVFKVDDVDVLENIPWLHGRFESGKKGEHLILHPSFLRPYRPVVLDDQVELSGVRLVTTVANGRRTVGIRGCLRNISGGPLKDFSVVCSFRNAAGDELDMKRASFVELPPHRLIEFQTVGTDRLFASVTIQPSYLGANSRPRYLSSVSISRAVE